MGEFPTAEAALQAHKDPNNKEYVKKQTQSRSPLASKNMGMKAQLRNDWKDVRENIMYNILLCKFTQHPQLRDVLLATGLAPIIHRTRSDTVWGDGGGKGENLLGKILVQIRTYFLRKSDNIIIKNLQTIKNEIT